MARKKSSNTKKVPKGKQTCETCGTKHDNQAEHDRQYHPETVKPGA